MSDLNVSLSPSGLVGLEGDKVQKEMLNKQSISTQSIDTQTIESRLPVDSVVKESKKATHEEIEVALVEVNAFVQSMQRNLSFTIDEQLGDEIISITDAETNEVIRQIPSEELVVLRKKMDDVVGILFDTKV